MPKSRTNVMLSSTSRDLPVHRDQATEAILRSGMFPIIMETLTASVGDAISKSLGFVDDAEVYVGIFGMRYGYIPDDPRRNPNHISITEMEYRHAMKRSIPVLIFIMSDKHPGPATATEGQTFYEQSEEGKAKLKTLKTELKTKHVVGFFDSPDDLRAQLIQALTALTITHLIDSEAVKSTTTSSKARNLEAAMPACTQIGTDTQVKVKISRPGSTGLRAELPEVLPSGNIIQQDDVRASSFPLAFPVDAQTGKLLPGKVCIEVVSGDFTVSTRSAYGGVCEPNQVASEIPPDQDSRTLNFTLTPKPGQTERLSTVYIYIYQNGQLIVEADVQTQIVASMDALPICGDWRLQLKQLELVAIQAAAPARTNIEQNIGTMSGGTVIGSQVDIDSKTNIGTLPPAPLAARGTSVNAPPPQESSKPKRRLNEPWAIIIAAVITGAFVIIGTLISNGNTPSAVPTNTQAAPIVSDTPSSVIPTDTNTPPPATDTTAPSETPVSTTPVPASDTPVPQTPPTTLPSGEANLRLFMTHESFTLVVDEAVNLNGLQFRVVAATGTRTEALTDFFDILQLTGGVAQAGDCYVLVKDGAAPPLAGVCKVPARTFKRNVAPADVFWYDSVGETLLSVAIDQNGVTTDQVCPASEQECGIRYGS